MKIVKVVNVNSKYQAKNGKEYTQVNYYVVLDNNKYVAIRPAFAKGYASLDAVAEEVKNGK